jgi:3D (Asp-Asp-Asp) domain-containing protein
MSSRAFKILLFLIIIYNILFSIDNNIKLFKLRVQVQEIGLITQELNKKVDNLSKNNWFFPKSKNLYVNFKLTVTAYNSEVNQTDKDPNTGAWNNRVRPGMIAVSRDLEKFGLTNGVPVKIEDYEHTNTIILDRMGKYKTVKGREVKIERSLDIWMKSKKEAKLWGVEFKNVKIPIEYVNIDELIANGLKWEI